MTRTGRPVDVVKQDDILRAATRLFLELGYDSCALEAIAEEAGVSKVTIYRHFDSKSKLLRRAIDLWLERVKCASRFAKTCGTPYERLRNFAMELHEKIADPAFVKAERWIMADMHHFGGVGEAFLDATWRAFHSELVSLLSCLQGRGDISVADSELAAEQLLFLFCGTAELERRFGQCECQRQRHARIDGALKTFFAAYGADIADQKIDIFALAEPLRPRQGPGSKS